MICLWKPAAIQNIQLHSDQLNALLSATSHTFTVRAVSALMPLCLPCNFAIVQCLQPSSLGPAAHSVLDPLTCDSAQVLLLSRQTPGRPAADRSETKDPAQLNHRLVHAESQEAQGAYGAHEEVLQNSSSLAEAADHHQSDCRSVTKVVHSICLAVMPLLHSSR